MSSRFLAGLDLGQAADFSAMIIAERVREGAGRSRYDVRFVKRWPLGSSYPTIVSDVVGTLGRAELGRQFRLIVDGTGVGRAVVDLFKAERMLTGFVPVMITAGALASEQEGGWWHVPKRDLVGMVQVLLQQRRLRFAQGLPETALLTSELQSFQVKVTASANETFAAREGQHDDLVLALALAVWSGEREPTGLGISMSVLAGRRVKGGWGYGRTRDDDTRRGIVTRHENAFEALVEAKTTASGR